jgi:hypothetical protein
VELLKRYAGNKGTALIYPNMYSLYGLSGVRPATFAYQHWIDVCPDKVVRKDATTILEHPPDVIVLMEMPEFYYSFHEAHFRGRRFSGQRFMHNAITTLISGDRYKLMDTFVARGHPPIKVWVLRANLKNKDA